MTAAYAQPSLTSRLSTALYLHPKLLLMLLLLNANIKLKYLRRFSYEYRYYGKLIDRGVIGNRNYDIYLPPIAREGVRGVWW